MPRGYQSKQGALKARAPILQAGAPLSLGTLPSDGLRFGGTMHFFLIQCFPTLPLFLVLTFSNSHYYPWGLRKVGSPED